MRTITLTKHHGLGNDFLVVDATEVEAVAAHCEPGDLARRLCDRRRGIGADGLMIASPTTTGRFRMVLHNADGSRAEISGNGIRCFAQAIARRRGTFDPVSIETDAGHRHVSVAATESPGTILATVDMGAVGVLDEPTGWAELGCHPDRPVVHLGLGNPHSVVGVDEIEPVDLAALGAKVPHVNLEIVAPGDRQHEILMRVHERGVGITEACGTGACAAAYAASRWGLATPLDGKLTVRMDGGSVTVAVDHPESGRVTLTGPATFVGTIEVEL